MRNWDEPDRDAFHRLNSDAQVMRFFASRRTRSEADAFMDRLRVENAGRGYGFGAVVLKENGRCIGMAGLKPTKDVPVRQPEAIEIGWRLLPEFWGKGFATEAAQALLALGFETLNLPEIVSFAVWNNEASIAVMRRIGMDKVEGGDFDHPAVPDTSPGLRRHVLYALTREAWERGHAGRASPLSPS